LYDDPTELCGTEYETYLRAMWLSRRDWVGFATAALTAPVDGYCVAYAVSNNPARIFELEPSIRLLGYRPQDSSDDFDWSRSAESPPHPAEEPRIPSRSRSLERVPR